MLLYHGTSFRFLRPSLSQCKPYRDFGCGFYTALDYFDALPMAIKNSDVGYVMTFEFSDFKGINTLELDGRPEEWLRFVVSSRLGERSNYDLVIGNTAGGGKNLKSKFAKFRRTNAAVEDVMCTMREQLTSTNLGVQYAFLTPKALSKLILLNIETVERECAI